SLADQPVKGRNYSPRGSLTTDIPPGDNGHGSYLMRVAYTDQGNEPIGPLTSEKIIALRNPVLNPEKYDEAKGNRLLTTPSRSFSMVGDQSYIAFDDIDLTGIKNIEIFGEAPPRENATGCTVEIHLDTPNGQLISTQGEIEARDNNYREIVRNMKAENTKKGKPEEEIDYDQARRLAYSVVNANVENIEGIHKIYFVFRNPRAEQDQVLTRLFSIEFRSDNEVL
ncbi:MAG: hypothetical protein KDC53_06760, partial [Saprospiraceae bacterium]|nr:hypothetical protein [Saprospiraceae bacterium]